VAERVPRLRRAKDVLVAEPERSILVDGSRIRDGPARVEVVVEDGQRAHVPGKADGEPARGVVVAEEDVGEGVSALFGGVELLQQGGGGVGDPGLGDGLAGGEDDDGWDARGGDGFDEGSLGADEVEGVDVDVFAGSSGIYNL